MEKIKYAKMIKVAKGYVDVPTSNNNLMQVYAEMWTNVYTGMYQIRLFFKKEYSYSYTTGSYRFNWCRESDSFIHIWMDAFELYNPDVRAAYCGCGLIEIAIHRSRLHVFEEPSKALTDRQKRAAEMYVLCGLSIDEIEHVFQCDIADVPQAFYDYAEEYGNKYDSDMRALQYKHDQFIEFLKTPFGYVWIMQHYPHVSVASLTDGLIAHDYMTGDENLGDWLFEYKETMKVAQKHELTGEVLSEILRGASFKDALREWDLIQFLNAALPRSDVMSGWGLSPWVP